MSIKKRCVAMILAASIAGMSVVGCYGSNALFNKVHDFNGSIGDKWIASLLHFVMWIVPVYGLSLFADIVIFNLIEFWTGSNPIAMGDTFEYMDENGNKIYAVKNADGTLTVNTTVASGDTSAFVMERAGNEFRVRNTEGELIGFHTVR